MAIIQDMLVRSVVLLSLVSLVFASNACTLCLSTPQQSLVLNTNDAAYEQYELILEYNNLLCNRSFVDIEDLKRCLTRAEQYATDRVRDLHSEAERHHETITIRAESMCQVLAACVTSCCLNQWTPEQVHLSLGSDTDMVVMWTTQSELGTPSVAYWENLSSNSPKETSIEIQFVNATSNTYDSSEWIGHIYTANITGLPSVTSFNYQLCGIAATGYTCFSTIRNFTTPPAPSTAPLTARFTSTSLLPWIPGQTAAIACLFADISTESNGNETSQSLEVLRKNGTIQVVVAAGDLSYADGTVSIWDDYLRMIEPYAAYIPFLTAPGNHENYYDFASYYARFTMPIAASNSPSKQYYSFNYEKIHFVSFSVEESDGSSLLPGAPQRKWLEADLQQANLERDVRPWIILFGHRPFYCSTDSTDCTDVAPKLRELLEDVINQYHVDIVVSGHKHNYERSFPVYQSNPTASDYVNPAAPIYYVCGTGGRDKDSSFLTPEPSWSADRDDKYGYLFASAPDQNSIQLYYLSKSFNVHDSATIQRTTPITNWAFVH